MSTSREFNPKPKMGMNANEVKFALNKMFSAKKGWLTVEELFVHGFDRYIDLWAMRVHTLDDGKKWEYQFKYLSIHAIEIKISRSDFQAEMKTPAKSLAAKSFSNFFSFAAPRGIIDPDELPRGIGLIEFSGAKGKWIRYPKYTRAEPPGWELIAAMGRSILKS